MKIIFISPAESGTTNRRLRDKKALLDFKRPFDIIPEYKKSYEKEIFAKIKSKNRFSLEKTSPSPVWSQLLNVVRTYFEETSP